MCLKFITWEVSLGADGIALLISFSNERITEFYSYKSCSLDWLTSY